MGKQTRYKFETSKSRNLVKEEGQRFTGLVSLNMLHALLADSGLWRKF
jgi:hypothetical protein